jgi:hypothetical protein
LLIEYVTFEKHKMQIKIHKMLMASQLYLTKIYEQNWIMFYGNTILFQTHCLQKKKL